MSNQIQGVPEGWELVRIDIPAKGDWFIDVAGRPREYPYEANGGGVFPIIRKIEKPARYRRFKDTEEYMPHWGKPIRLKGGVGFDSVVSTSRIGIYVASETLIVRYSMADAFERFEFADGTPFGVRIDE
jgi:hypothetical protein